jgi:hypothetical protein
VWLSWFVQGDVVDIVMQNALRSMERRNSTPGIFTDTLIVGLLKWYFDAETTRIPLNLFVNLTRYTFPCGRNGCGPPFVLLATNVGVWPFLLLAECVFRHGRLA